MTFPNMTVVGGGQMARALLGGMLKQGLTVESSIQVVDVQSDCRQWWQQNHPGVTATEDLAGAIRSSEMVLLAVKPPVVPVVLNQADWAGRLIVSIAAGVSLNTLVEGVGHGRVARVMPNTPAMVGQGASGVCFGTKVSSDDRRHVSEMLTSVGVVVSVAETQMDAVTALSGSGPAYVFLMIEAMADGGVAAGLPRETAIELATQTVLGAATMVRNTGMHPGQLKDNVCSPSGTTIAAIEHLEQNAVRGAMIGAIQKAAARSRELG
ncbi:MAG: pyrroline-5-carboxylate reductase [Planctomycetota bacterium]